MLLLLLQEYAKMIHVLQAYCIISTGVRITCSNQNGQGKRSTVLSTSASQSMRDNIGAIFGPKQVLICLWFFYFKAAASKYSAEILVSDLNSLLCSFRVSFLSTKYVLQRTFWRNTDLKLEIYQHRLFREWDRCIH